MKLLKLLKKSKSNVKITLKKCYPYKIISLNQLKMKVKIDNGDDDKENTPAENVIIESNESTNENKTSIENESTTKTDTNANATDENASENATDENASENATDENTKSENTIDANAIVNATGEKTNETETETIENENGNSNLPTINLSFLNSLLSPSPLHTPVKPTPPPPQLITPPLPRPTPLSITPPPRPTPLTTTPTPSTSTLPTTSFTTYTIKIPDLLQTACNENGLNEEFDMYDDNNEDIIDPDDFYSVYEKVKDKKGNFDFLEKNQRDNKGRKKKNNKVSECQTIVIVLKGSSEKEYIKQFIDIFDESLWSLGYSHLIAKQIHIKKKEGFFFNYSSLQKALNKMCLNDFTNLKRQCVNIDSLYDKDKMKKICNKRHVKITNLLNKNNKKESKPLVSVFWNTYITDKREEGNFAAAQEKINDVKNPNYYFQDIYLLYFYFSEHIKEIFKFSYYNE